MASSVTRLAALYTTTPPRDVDPPRRLGDPLHQLMQSEPFRMQLSAELDAELQEVDMLSGKLDAELQEVDMEADPVLEEVQQQNFHFSETNVELGKRKLKQQYSGQ